MPSFFVPAKIGDVPQSAARIVEALGTGFEGSLVRAALSEALLNAIIYGTLGVRPEPGVRDPVEFHEAIRMAELQAGPRAGVDVAVRGDPDDPAERIVLISDSGPGFSWRSQLLRLADADASPEDPTDLATSGRGLALILAGTRAVEWNEVGNEVSLRFRSSHAKPPSSLSRVPGVDPFGATLPPGASPRILVVDDVDINCRLISKMLEWEGYQVRSAGDGQTAIAEVESWQPEIVVMDVNMPRMTGLEAVRHMRDKGILARTSVMLLTAGNFDGEFKSDAIEAGACAFLEKPISRRELVARVGQRLKMRETLNRAQRSQAALEVSMSQAATVMVSLMPPARIDASPGRIETLVAPTHAVGGDVVDFIRVDVHVWAVFLLDVAGHGLASALTASASRAVLLDQIRSKGSLAGALTSLNERLMEDFDRTGHQAAVAAAFVDARRGVVDIINAGCPPVALWTHDGQARLVRSGSPPAGLIGSVEFASAQFSLSEVARIVIASDGIVEAFGTPTDTLGALAIVCGTSDLPGLTNLPSERIYTALTRLGPERDDASMVWIDFTPHGGSKS